MGQVLYAYEYVYVEKTLTWNSLDDTSINYAGV